MAQAKKVIRRRREKKNIERGQVHIRSSFNNTMVTVTDTQGNAISWASSGGLGFRGSKTVSYTHLVEDQKIRKYLKKTLYGAGVPKIEIERSSDTVTIFLHCARPGVVIGKGGEQIEQYRKDVEKLIGKTAVSYTHLDVYKRQAGLHQRSVCGQLRYFPRLCGQPLQDRTSVSYTHLYTPFRAYHSGS